MNREIWKEKYFSTYNPKKYPCPICKIGYLDLTKQIETKITGKGKHDLEYDYPYGIDCVFTGILECSNKYCKEAVTVSGKCLKDIHQQLELPDGTFKEERFSIYYPMYFYPYLEIIELPDNLPNNIKIQIYLSFSNYFDDISSCANRIRNAIELMLDDLKAPKRKKTRQGKYINLRNLHNRIIHYGKKQKKISTLLLALKIIGNKGSHAGDIQDDDILDAYEILEQVIEIAYAKKSKKIEKIAIEIVTKNKPRTK